MSSAPPARQRLYLLPLLVLVPILGLGSRSELAAHLPAFVATYAGDTLWAALVYLCLAFLGPRLPVGRVAAVALAISFLDELSQLYHAPWIDTLRAHRLGALLLGHTFVWSDLACYTVGVALAAGVDALLPRVEPGQASPSRR